MKINGKKISGPGVEIIPIPLAGGEDLIFKAAAVRDYSEFERACPEPKPPMVKKANGEDAFDAEDPNFLKQVHNYGAFKLAWMIVKSLSATPGLEWDTVKAGDRSTWENWQTDLLNAGLTVYHIRLLVEGVMAANGLSEARMVEARKRFLASQQAAPQ